jgi:hypothetical protein
MPAAAGGARASTRPAGLDGGDGVAALKALVIVMGVLIVAGTVTLVVLIVQKVGGAAPGAAAMVALGEPEGARIGGIAATDRSLAVWVVRPDGADRVILLDAASGRRIGEVRLRD